MTKAMFNMREKTLAEARAEVEKGCLDGVTCPCCGRYVRLYKRKLSSSMTRALIWLVLTYSETGDWIDVPNTAPAWILRTKQLSICEWWGLIERMEKDPEDTAKKHSGFWRPTLKGEDYVHGLIRVPAYVYHRAGPVVVAFSESTTNVREALGKNFDYEKLMTGEPG